MRSAQGREVRSKRSKASSGRTQEETEARLARTREKIKKAESYLENELDRLVKEEGNAPDTIRLLKHFYEVRKEAWTESQEAQRLDGSTGTEGDFLGRGIEHDPVDPEGQQAV